MSENAIEIVEKKRVIGRPFQKGVVQNPTGRPKNAISWKTKLERAMKKEGFDLCKHLIARAKKNDKVLTAIAKKFLPDMSAEDLQVSGLPEQKILIIRPERTHGERNIQTKGIAENIPG